MSDTLEGIEKDPRVESLYAASKNSPGLCDVREEIEHGSAEIRYIFVGPKPCPEPIKLHIEIHDIDKFIREMTQAAGRAFILKDAKHRMIRNPSGRMEAVAEVEFAPFDPRDAFIRVVDDPRQDPQTLTPACGGYHDPRQAWGAQYDDGDDVSLAEDVQD